MKPTSGFNYHFNKFSLQGEINIGRLSNPLKIAICSTSLQHFQLLIYAWVSDISLIPSLIFPKTARLERLNLFVSLLPN